MSDKRKETKRLYRLKNKEKHRLYYKQWCIDNKDKCSKYVEEYRKRNPEKTKERKALWLEKNPNYYKEYKLNHKKEHSKYIHNYNKKKRIEDPVFRIKCNIRNRIKSTLKSKNWHKDNKTLEILGCSVEQLKLYIEEKFMIGMTWDNYGKWEIDHIIPISSAKTKEEVYKLNHYSNLQPLWKLDNIKKGHKIT